MPKSIIYWKNPWRDNYEIYLQPWRVLTCDKEIKGMTLKMSDSDTRHYGVPYFICESMSIGTARFLVAALRIAFQSKGSESWELVVKE